MYDFDVIFLLIAQPASLRVGDMLGLHDCLAGSGMCTTVATSPTDLATIGKRLRIIVIDGEGDSDFDVYAVVAEMRQLDNVAIILLADETAMARERGLYAGADLCLPAWIAHADFFRSVIELASGQPLAAPSRDERVALKRKRPRRRHYLGLHPRSRYYR